MDVHVQVEMKSTRLTDYVSSPSTESYNGVLDISMVIFNVDVCSNSKNKCDVTTNCNNLKVCLQMCIQVHNLTLNLSDLSMFEFATKGSGRIIMGFTFPCTKRIDGRSSTNVKYVDEMLKML